MSNTVSMCNKKSQFMSWLQMLENREDRHKAIMEGVIQPMVKNGIKGVQVKFCLKQLRSDCIVLLKKLTPLEISTYTLRTHRNMKDRNKGGADNDSSSCQRNKAKTKKKWKRVQILSDSDTDSEDTDNNGSSIIKTSSDVYQKSQASKCDNIENNDSVAVKDRKVLTCSIISKQEDNLSGDQQRSSSKITHNKQSSDNVEYENINYFDINVSEIPLPKNTPPKHCNQNTVSDLHLCCDQAKTIYKKNNPNKHSTDCSKSDSKSINDNHPTLVSEHINNSNKTKGNNPPQALLTSSECFASDKSFTNSSKTLEMNAITIPWKLKLIEKEEPKNNHSKRTVTDLYNKFKKTHIKENNYPEVVNTNEKTGKCPKNNLNDVKDHFDNLSMPDLLPRKCGSTIKGKDYKCVPADHKHSVGDFKEELIPGDTTFEQANKKSVVTPNSPPSSRNKLNTEFEFEISTFEQRDIKNVRSNERPNHIDKHNSNQDKKDIFEDKDSNEEVINNKLNVEESEQTYTYEKKKEIKNKLENHKEGNLYSQAFVSDKENEVKKNSSQKHNNQKNLEKLSHEVNALFKPDFQYKTEVLKKDRNERKDELGIGRKSQEVDEAGRNGYLKDDFNSKTYLTKKSQKDFILNDYSEKSKTISRQGKNSEKGKRPCAKIENCFGNKEQESKNDQKKSVFTTSDKSNHSSKDHRKGTAAFNKDLCETKINRITGKSAIGNKDCPVNKNKTKICDKKLDTSSTLTKPSKDATTSSLNENHYKRKSSDEKHQPSAPKRSKTDYELENKSDCKFDYNSSSIGSQRKSSVHDKRKEYDKNEIKSGNRITRRMSKNKSRSDSSSSDGLDYRSDNSDRKKQTIFSKTDNFKSAPTIEYGASNTIKGTKTVIEEIKPKKVLSKVSTEDVKNDTNDFVKGDDIYCTSNELIKNTLNHNFLREEVQNKKRRNSEDSGRDTSDKNIKTHHENSNINKLTCSINIDKTYIHSTVDHLPSKQCKNKFLSLEVNERSKERKRKSLHEKDLSADTDQGEQNMKRRKLSTEASENDGGKTSIHSVTVGCSSSPKSDLLEMTFDGEIVDPKFLKPVSHEKTSVLNQEKTEQFALNTSTKDCASGISKERESEISTLGFSNVGFELFNASGCRLGLETRPVVKRTEKEIYTRSVDVKSVTRPTVILNNQKQGIETVSDNVNSKKSDYSLNSHTEKSENLGNSGVNSTSQLSDSENRTQSNNSRPEKYVSNTISTLEYFENQNNEYKHEKSLLSDTVVSTLECKLLMDSKINNKISADSSSESNRVTVDDIQNDNQMSKLTKESNCTSKLVDEKINCDSSSKYNSCLERHKLSSESEISTFELLWNKKSSNSSSITSAMHINKALLNIDLQRSPSLRDIKSKHNISNNCKENYLSTNLDRNINVTETEKIEAVLSSNSLSEAVEYSVNVTDCNQIKNVKPVKCNFVSKTSVLDSHESINSLDIASTSKSDPSQVLNSKVNFEDKVSLGQNDTAVSLKKFSTKTVVPKPQKQINIYASHNFVKPGSSVADAERPFKFHTNRNYIKPVTKMTPKQDSKNVCFTPEQMKLLRFKSDHNIMKSSNSVNISKEVVDINHKVYKDNKLNCNVNKKKKMYIDLFGEDCDEGEAGSVSVNKVNIGNEYPSGKEQTESEEKINDMYTPVCNAVLNKEQKADFYFSVIKDKPNTDQCKVTPSPVKMDKKSSKKASIIKIMKQVTADALKFSNKTKNSFNSFSTKEQDEQPLSVFEDSDGPSTQILPSMPSIDESVSIQDLLKTFDGDRSTEEKDNNFLKACTLYKAPLSSSVQVESCTLSVSDSRVVSDLLHAQPLTPNILSSESSKLANALQKRKISGESIDLLDSINSRGISEVQNLIVEVEMNIEKDIGNNRSEVPNSSQSCVQEDSDHYTSQLVQLDQNESVDKEKSIYNDAKESPDSNTLDNDSLTIDECVVSSSITSPELINIADSPEPINIADSPEPFNESGATKTCNNESKIGKIRVKGARELGIVTEAIFSPSQTMLFDCLRSFLPENDARCQESNNYCQAVMPISVAMNQKENMLIAEQATSSLSVPKTTEVSLKESSSSLTSEQTRTENSQFVEMLATDNCTADALAISSPANDEIDANLNSGKSFSCETTPFKVKKSNEENATIKSQETAVSFQGIEQNISKENAVVSASLSQKQIQSDIPNTSSTDINIDQNYEKPIKSEEIEEKVTSEDHSKSIIQNEIQNNVQSISNTSLKEGNIEQNYEKPIKSEETEENVTSESHSTTVCLQETEQNVSKGHATVSALCNQNQIESNVQNISNTSPMNGNNCNRMSERLNITLSHNRDQNCIDRVAEVNVALIQNEQHVNNPASKQSIVHTRSDSNTSSNLNITRSCDQEFVTVQMFSSQNVEQNFAAQPTVVLQNKEASARENTSKIYCEQVNNWLNTSDVLWTRNKEYYARIYKITFNNCVTITPKLAEILHLILTYKKAMGPQIAQIRKLSSESLIQSETKRIEKAYHENILARGKDFCKFLFSFLKKFDAYVKTDIFLDIIYILYIKVIEDLLNIDLNHKDNTILVRSIISDILEALDKKSNILYFLFKNTDEKFQIGYTSVKKNLQSLFNCELVGHYLESKSSDKTRVAGNNSNNNKTASDLNNFTISTQNVNRQQSSEGQNSTLDISSSSHLNTTSENSDDVFVRHSNPDRAGNANLNNYAEQQEMIDYSSLQIPTSAKSRTLSNIEQMCYIMNSFSSTGKSYNASGNSNMSLMSPPQNVGKAPERMISNTYVASSGKQMSCNSDHNNTSNEMYYRAIGSRRNSEPVHSAFHPPGLSRGRSFVENTPLPSNSNPIHSFQTSLQTEMFSNSLIQPNIPYKTSTNATVNSQQPLATQTMPVLPNANARHMSYPDHQRLQNNIQTPNNQLSSRQVVYNAFNHSANIPHAMQHHELRAQQNIDLQQNQLNFSNPQLCTVQMSQQITQLQTVDPSRQLYNVNSLITNSQHSSVGIATQPMYPAQPVLRNNPPAYHIPSVQQNLQVDYTQRNTSQLGGVLGQAATNPLRPTCYYPPCNNPANIQCHTCNKVYYCSSKCQPAASRFKGKT